MLGFIVLGIGLATFVFTLQQLSSDQKDVYWVMN